MTINELLRTLGRAWWVLLLSTSLGLGASLSIRAITPPMFTAETSILVSVDPQSDALEDIQNAQTISRVVAQNAVSITTSAEVLRPSAERLNNGSTATTLRAATAVTNPQGTSVVDIAVTAGDEQDAITGANEIASSFVQFAQSSEELRPGGDASRFSFTTLGVASTAAIVQPGSSRELMLGAGVGLAVGSITVVTIDWRRRTKASSLST